MQDESLPIVGLAQLYRDRVDCENIFDEIKNQWGWAGFVTRDLKRCRIVARLIAIVNNWWNVFTRLARTAEQLGAEAIWAMILSAAFVKWLRGKVLRPVMHGDQVLLQLTE